MSALDSGRAAALRRMTSLATIRRATGTTVQDETTGREEPVWAVTYTDHPIRLAGVTRGDSPSRRTEVAGIEFEVAGRVANLPYDTDNLADGDLIEITDGENAGVVIEVIEATWQDQATARRIPVRRVDPPAEWSA